MQKRTERMMVEFMYRCIALGLSRKYLKVGKFDWSVLGLFYKNRVPEGGERGPTDDLEENQERREWRQRT